MNILKIFLSVTLLMLAFSMSSCDGTNSDTNSTTTSAPITNYSTNTTTDIAKIVIDGGNNKVVTQNGEIVTINLSVYDNNNSFYPNGNIKIRYPDEVLSGKDVGSFNATMMPIVNGKASFTYTAPNPLVGNQSLLFTLYHDAYPSLSKQDLNISIVPKEGQIILKNYVLNAIYNTNMNLETTKSMTFYVADDSGMKIDNNHITSVAFRVLNPALGTLEDTSGHTGSSLKILNQNNIQINLKSNKISGLIPLKVTAIFQDANNNVKTLTRVFNVVVMSGPPTAMSLSYAGVEQNISKAKFRENWVLTVTDKYNNLVNTKPVVSMGALIGYTNDSSNSALNIANYLYFNSSTNDGNLIDSNPDTFTSVHNAFENVDLVNDNLVLFGGRGYKFNAYGKWDINSIIAANKLELKDDFNGSSVSGLNYAIGHNFRNEMCSGSPVVANVYAKDYNNTLGSNGSMILQVEYDYYLVGKSVILWTNLVGEHNNTTVKVGLGKKVTLRGSGLTGESYSYAKGFSGKVRLNITITNTVEYYKNANFAYAVEVSGDDTNWTISGDSMKDGNITDCSLNSGVGYVDVNITSPASNAGTIKITNVLPSNEF